jgi:hypothetical protein
VRVRNAARSYAQRKGSGWVIDRDKELRETVRLARRAVELGRDDAVALLAAGWALASVAGDLDTGARSSTGRPAGMIPERMTPATHVPALSSVVSWPSQVRPATSLETLPIL